MHRCDIAVIGAGAAGLSAAIFAAETARAAAHPVAVVALDGAASIGAKILIAGGGRCNVSNAAVSAGDFNGTRHIVRNVLAGFDVAATCRWFATLGVALKEEEHGKLFPVTDSARTVLDALLRRCADLGVSVRPDHGVHRLRRGNGDGGFCIDTGGQALQARAVVVATGGRSLPRTGSDGSGWELVRTLGHTVTPTFPALVPLVLAANMFHAELSGVSQPVELSLWHDGKRIDRRVGSMLWTHFGVSGPVVLDASRHWITAHAAGGSVELRCNFLPPDDFTAAEEWLRRSIGTQPRLSLGRCLAQRLPDRLALRLAGCAGCDPQARAATLTRAQRRALAHALTSFSLPVQRDRGWDFAEVTAGGVPLDEIDYRTLASRRVPGLYLVGEMLDCDGRIGGFNFQWAWSTGYLAGRAAAGVLVGTAAASCYP